MPYLKDNRLAQFMAANPVLSLVMALLVCVSMVLLAGPNYKFAVIPALSLPVIFFIWKKPFLGFYAILFLTPFDEFTALSETYKFMTIPKVIGVLTVIILFLHYIIYHDHGYDFRSGLWKWLLLFWLVGLVSAFMSEYQFTSYNTLRRFFTGYVFFLMTLAFVSKNDFKYTLPGLIVFATSISVLLSILGYFTRSPLFLMSVRSEFSRITGGAGDPNEFAIMMVFALPIYAFLIYRAKTAFKKITLMLFFGLCAIAVINTYSRTGALILLGTLFLIVLQYLRFLKPRTFGFILLGMTIAVVCAITVIPSSYWNRQKTMTDRKTDFSVGRRFSYLVVAFDNFREHPILGTGPGTFKDVYGASRWTLNYAREEESPKRVAHNSYVEVLTGTGLIGLFFFMLIIFIALRNFFTARRQFRQTGDIEMENLVMAYFAAFWVILCAFLFLSINFHKYFWLLLGISQVSLRLASENENKPNYS